MSATTEISWTDATFNPWIGCTKVSPGCDHCYAERDFDLRKGRVKWGAGNPRSRTSPANWKLPLRWNRTPFYECQACGQRGDDPVTAPGLRINDPEIPSCRGCGSAAMRPARRRVFCASLADVLDNEAPVEWLVDLLDLIRRTPNLDWLLLTKRIGIARRRLGMAYTKAQALGHDELWPWIGALLDGNPPSNVWLGATIVNQEADRDIPKLLAVPARVRFLSMEPLLGPVSFEGLFANPKDPRDGTNALEELDWVIAGSESGPKARPSHPDWFRDLRDQCAAAGVPFHFKQWGEWADADAAGVEQTVKLATPVWRWQNDTHAERTHYSACVGKKNAGRLLDGRTWNESPRATARGAHE